MSHSLRLFPYGQYGWMLQVTENDKTSLDDVVNHLESDDSIDFVEWVIAYDSLLILFSERPTELALREFLAKCPKLKADEPRGRLIEIPLSYDGPDLEGFSRAVGLSPEEVKARHQAPVYSVRFMGFAPGFAYLDGLDPSLHLPRRSSPRARMSAGAVAIGGAHAGVYSVPSPGGWHWLGNTDYPLFNPTADAEGCFVLSPGDRVKFIDSI